MFILDFQDLGLQPNKKYLSKFTLSNGQVIKAFYKGKAEVALRAVSDTIKLIESGVSEEECERFNHCLKIKSSIL